LYCLYLQQWNDNQLKTQQTWTKYGLGLAIEACGKQDLISN